MTPDERPAGSEALVTLAPLPPKPQEAPTGSAPGRATGPLGAITDWREARRARATRTFIEGFRLLALNLWQQLKSEPKRSILVLSANPDEGRSMTVGHLARAIAETGVPVVVIDADPEGSGLEPIAQTGNGSVVTTPDAPPAAEPEGRKGNGHLGRSAAKKLRSRSSVEVVSPWLGSTEDDFLAQVDEAIQAGIDKGAFVIVDGPACTVSSAGFYLSTSVTGVLYVARRKSIGEAAVHAEVRAQLDLLGAKVLGVVINEG
jgi:protein-tyrosine kinase